MGEKRKMFCVSLAILGLLVSSAFGEEVKEEKIKKAEELPEVVVTGEKIITPTKETAETVYTGTGITEKGI